MKIKFQPKHQKVCENHSRLPKTQLKKPKSKESSDFSLMEKIGKAKPKANIVGRIIASMPLPDCS